MFKPITFGRQQLPALISRSSQRFLMETLETRALLSVTSTSMQGPMIPVTASEVVHPLETNPLIGTYAGTLTRVGTSNTFKFKVTVKAKTSVKLSFALAITIPTGEVDISLVIKPHSNGSFSTTFGSSKDLIHGTMAGHLNNGKLVLTTAEPGGYTLTGSGKRK